MINRMKFSILLICGLLCECTSAINTAQVKTQTGIASWYGKKFHGRTTANGEIYDMNGMTAAHKTLPFNTRVRVVNLDNGRVVVVRINDRGPFVKGRIIDLSRKAAGKVGMLNAGLANVRLEILFPLP